MVGTGVIILTVLWLTALIIWLFAVRIGGKVAFAAVGTFFLALIVTITLWLMPKGPLPEDNPDISYDTSYAGRVVLLFFCWLMAVLGLVTVALIQLFQQHQAVSIKTF
ncbi:hypothetical protein HELRODRAFT_170658 [Helobdella robusta]|uniref:Transmembrane protein 218 N-terminal domain-containing protein n=1 Tax=Helobdella robusta TaxID=6412 RepID=T1F3A7_HELRO|nr:hypothetical protein HELRODRAFT_170658 [Helobdella robusta]ESO07327.1 hypothetical protein HELRODRAFT_170658 [Helobdella robusta]